VIYDVGMPYSSNWDLLEVIRTAPALQSQPFVITTPSKRKLEQAVGLGDVMLILLIVVLILLFGGGGNYYEGRGANWRGPHYGGGLLGLVLIIQSVLRLSGRMGPGMLR